MAMEDLYVAYSGTTRDYFLTQFEIIKSREFAERVVRVLGLVKHPEFDPRQAPRPWYATKDAAAPELTDAQVSYAASDVQHLHALKDRLDTMLAREGRTELAKACFGFLPDRVRLDLAGWAAEDIFSHSS